MREGMREGTPSTSWGATGWFNSGKGRERNHACERGAGLVLGPCERRGDRLPLGPGNKLRRQRGTRQR
eukprot:3470989-Alexandrium_andersonii.AAC.1